MTAKELIEILKNVDEDTKVMLLSHERYFVEIDAVIEGLDLSSGKILVIC